VIRPAVFLDRDGTLIRDFHFIGKPEMVELLPGVGRAVRKLNDAGWPVIVVTNQSGIARGFFSEADYERVRKRLDDLLGGEAGIGDAESGEGARIDASYMCPHHPDFTGACECRKPGTLLFRRAADDRGIDLSQSWYIGDKLRDVLPAHALGAGRRAILIPNDETPREETARSEKEFSVAASLDEAVDRIIESGR
jgi:D-glycero-D-manno-heptose 1,7-bisphosphate phosphatase